MTKLPGWPAAGWVAAIGLTVLCAASCDQHRASNLLSAGGGGGAAGSPTAETGGNCDAGLPEQCCNVADPRPCRGLGQTDCEANPLCRAITGTPWMTGQPIVPEGPRVYVGCQSICEDRAGADAFTCVFDARDAASCFLVSSEAMVPDGWRSFVDCDSLPEGACQ